MQIPEVSDDNDDPSGITEAPSSAEALESVEKRLQGAGETCFLTTATTTCQTVPPFLFDSFNCNASAPRSHLQLRAGMRGTLRKKVLAVGKENGML